MFEPHDACAAIFDQCARGEISPPTAMMKLLIETEDAAIVGVLLANARTNSRGSMRELANLHDRHREGCARIAAMLRSGVDSPEAAPSVEAGIAFAKRLFDWSVGESEEASVALHSLGSAEILAEGTREIVELLERHRCLDVPAGARVLDLGCGIGRIEVALAARVRSIVGIDVSEKMIAVATRRCAGLSNVELRIASGRDLRGHLEASFDLVLASDSMPYLVQSGMALVDAHFAEVARVLRRGGAFVILNFSYRDPPADDTRDVAALAELHGFELRVAGARELKLWDARSFLLRKRSEGTPAT